MKKVSYIGDGSTTEFNFNFPFYTNTDIMVLKNEQITTGYTIIGTSNGLNADIPYSGGKIVFNIAPLSMDVITICRKIPLTRVVDYQPTQKINPTTLNQDMNYMIEVLKDMQGDLDTFDEQYKDIINKESIQTVLSRIEYISQIFENNEIMKNSDFCSYFTNCITTIPQNLKFELDNNGTLTLKSGSKVYIPNGTNTFDNITTTTDLTVTRTDSNKCMVYYDINNNSIIVLPLNLFYSQNSAPNDYQFIFWYDTTNNKCKFTNDTGSTWTDGYSLPLCVVSTDGSKISSIDQVFNGFGFIGSTVFVLPGVSGMIPNGRNANGTLKSNLVTTNTVITRTDMGTNLSNYYVGLNNDYFLNYASGYSLEQDGFLHVQSGTIYNDVVFAKYTTGVDGRITSFTAKNVLQISDFNNI